MTCNICENIYVYIMLILSLFKFFNSADKSEVSPFVLLSIILPLSLHGYFLAISLIINVQMRFILTFWPIMMVIFIMALSKMAKTRKA
jgi:hypothetical protein